MHRLEVDVYTDVRPLVIRDPGRRFPGILIQGDTLSTLLADAEELTEQLSSANSAATEEASLLTGRLRELLESYERALTAHGVQLPYFR